MVIDISMSLDGFGTGPDPGPDNGLGKGTPLFDGGFAGRLRPTAVTPTSTATHRVDR